MTSKLKKRLSTVCMALGPVILGAGFARTSIESQLGTNFPDSFWLFLFVLGGLILLFGVFIQFTQDVRVQDLMPVAKRDYRIRPALESELKTIHQIADKRIGGVSPLKKMTQWHRINKYVFKSVIHVKQEKSGATERCVGYFCVIPITQSAVKRLLSGELVGSQFFANHIVRPRRKPAAVYVGGVAADGGKFAEGVTHMAMQNEVMNYWANFTQVAYARPTTKDGMGLIRRYDFNAVDPNDEGELDALYVLKLEKN